MGDKSSEVGNPPKDSGDKENKMAASVSNIANNDKVRTKSLSKQNRGRSGSIDKCCDETERQKSPSKNNTWNCDVCDGVFVDANDCLLTCEYCGNHRCLKCLGLTKTVYKAISGRPDMPWFCSDCMMKSLGILKEAKTIEDRCSDYLSDFSKKVENRMAKMEQDVSAMRVDMGKMKDELLKEIQDTGASVVGAVGGGGTGSSKVSGENSADNDKILSSLQDRMERKNNIVLYNVKEGDGNLKEEKIMYDKQEICKVAGEIGVTLQNDDTLSVRRLGKKGTKVKVHGEEVEVPRVVLATFTETVKATIMKNAFKLQFSGSEYLRKVSIKHDMSSEERKKESELRKEAKSMTQEEGNENFLFLVRGPVWDRKIVKVRKGGGQNGHKAG